MSKGNKKLRRLNLSSSEEAFEILAALDHVVQQFSPVHFRIDGRIDVWPSTKKWFDRVTFRRGAYTDLLEFARTHLAEIEETKLAIYG